MKYFAQKAQEERRELWMATVRNNIGKCLNPDGSGVMPQFNPTWREPLWILPALYTGDKEHIDLANKIMVRFNDPETEVTGHSGGDTGKRYAIFQSNITASLRHRFGDLMTDEALEAADWHCRALCRTFNGSGQPDYKFHGANDNMPTMATYGMIFAGEVLGIPEAVEHGLWNLEEVRRLLSRSAWMSEFNSSTYSPITLCGFARIAECSRTPEVRKLALEIEHRMWAELLLHYHPGTFMQAGPNCRSYAIDYNSHTHTMQTLFWIAFGEKVGRNPIKSYFEPDGREVLHFAGNPWQSIAEFCDCLDTELHVPEELAELVDKRNYPAIHKGRSECMSRYNSGSAVYHTETYMEEEFSLGTVNGPLCGGEQTTTSYVTYKRKPEVKDFRDSATVFFRYLMTNEDPIRYEASRDGAYTSEKFVPSKCYWYSMQKENTSVVLATPGLRNIEDDGFLTSKLGLYIYFPAHYGNITSSIVGKGPVCDGAVGESKEVVPVSVEAGEVYIHIQPLLPTNLERKVALRFIKFDNYEILELVNYEGEERKFTVKELEMALNGMVMTVVAKKNYASLEDFHKEMSDVMIRDYYAVDHRFFTYQRKDVSFEITCTLNPLNLQTEAVDGRAISRPVFESNQIDVNKLPFMSGPVPPIRKFFRWDTMEIDKYPDLSSIIGSRGLDSEAPYSKRSEVIVSAK